MGWEGWEGGRRKAQEEGDIYTHVPNSHCCTAKANTTLESNYLPIESKFFIIIFT